MLIGTQALVRSSTVCYMVYAPWYKIHVHGNVFPELSKIKQRINIMVSPLAKEHTTKETLPAAKDILGEEKIWYAK